MPLVSSSTLSMMGHGPRCAQLRVSTFAPRGFVGLFLSQHGQPSGNLHLRARNDMLCLASLGASLVESLSRCCAHGCSGLPV